jgi:hypothetical protein
MSYSSIHQRFADNLCNDAALDIPQHFLGRNWETILNFWKRIDTLTEEQWEVVAERYEPYHSCDQGKSLLVYNFSTQILSSHNSKNVWYASGTSVVCPYFMNPKRKKAYCGNATGYATLELICMHILFENGHKLLYVPMFDGL